MWEMGDTCWIISGITKKVDMEKLKETLYSFSGSYFYFGVLLEYVYML